MFLTRISKLVNTKASYGISFTAINYINDSFFCLFIIDDNNVLCYYYVIKIYASKIWQIIFGTIWR